MRLTALFAISALLTLLVACGDDDSLLKPDASNTPIASATPYAVLPNAIIIGASSGGPTGASGPATGTNGGSTGAGEVKYVVQSGDTLLGLAARYDTSVEAIMTRNNIASAADLRAGQELTIPAGTSSVATPAATAVRTATAAATAAATATSQATRTATAAATTTVGQRYTVQSGDLAGAIAARFGVTLDQLAAANNRTVASLDSLQIGETLNIPGS